MEKFENATMLFLVGVSHVVRDYQTLIAGLIAIGAAWITARPVWHQLDRMSVQTDTMYREFLVGRLQALQQRRKWLFEHIDPFRQQVSQRMYEMREEEGHLNIHWIFERAQLTGRLITDLGGYRNQHRDPAPMAAALDDVIARLRQLEETLDDIHRPHSTEQHGEDWSISDEQWAEIGHQGEVADQALDGLVTAFIASVSTLSGAATTEIEHLRNRLGAVDNALLERQL